MRTQVQKDDDKVKHKWRRTGRTSQELSFNKKGVITLAEEVNEKGTRRNVQVEYKSVTISEEDSKNGK